MKKKYLLRIWLSLAMLLFIGNKVYAQEAYTVLSNNNKTLTFYYDDNRKSRKGFFLNSYPYLPTWYEHLEEIEKVIFDASFVDARVTSTHRWFDDLKKLTEIQGLQYLNTSNVTDMSHMFANCSSLTNLDVSNFDTSNVTNMSFMFSRCSSLTNLDVSNFDTSNVTDMSYMFWLSSLKNLDMSNFDTSNVTNMKGLFHSCSSLTNLDIHNFNTNNMTDMSMMFCSCSSLTNLDVSNFDTSNVTDMSSMFSRCNSLTNLDVSNFDTSNVTDMSGMFNSCSSLTNLDVSSFDTSNVTDMSWMFASCSSLTNLNVSNFDTSNVTNMKYMFSSCSSLTNLNVSIFDTSNVTNMSSMFSSCSSLTNLDIHNFITNNMTDMRSLFFRCSSLNLLVPGYSIIQMVDDEMFFITIGSTSNPCQLLVPSDVLSLLNGKMNGQELCGGYFNISDSHASTHLNIIDEDGIDVKDHATILWYDSEGKHIGTGATLGGVEVNTLVYYSVTLDETLGRKYHEINKQEFIMEQGDFTCQLEKIQKVTLKGRVSAIDIDEEPANVQITQHLNGKYEEQLNTTSQEKGDFSIEVYDDLTDIKISRDDCISTTIHRDQFGESSDVGIIPLSLITGFPISININCQAAITPEETPVKTEWNNGLGTFEFFLTNETTKSSITDFIVQNNTLILKSGVQVGDIINIKIKSAKNEFAEGGTSLIISTDANTATIDLTETGGLRATFTSSPSGSNIAYLYDLNGMLVARGNYIGQELTINHLPAGDYILTSMVSSQLLSSVNALSELGNLGLAEGRDYVSSQITISDGVISAISSGEIPIFNESPFYYTNQNSYFNTNKAEVIVGNYLTLSAHIELKEIYTDKLNDATLYVDLPNDCQMVQGSVMVGHKIATYTQEGNRIAIPLTQKNYQDKVLFCIIPFSNRDYNISAYATLNIGSQVVQPIGIAQFKVKGFSINLQNNSASEHVIIRGTIAMGQSKVKVYDNDVLIGTTNSKSDGSWIATVELDKPYSPSIHNIYAKVITTEGLEMISESKQLLFDKTTIVPHLVTMSSYNGHYRKNIDIEFDLNSGTTSPSSYPFYTATDFTFKAYFSQNDPARVQNVNFKVLASDGTIRTIPGIFDAKQQAWVGTSRYSNSNKLPENVTVDYELIPVEIPFDPSRINDDNNQFINLVKNYVTDVDPAKFDILEANESMMVSKYQTYSMDSPVFIRIEKLDYDKWIDKLESTDYFTVDKEGTIVYIFDSEIISDAINFNLTS